MKLGQFLEPRVARMVHPSLRSHPRHELAMRQMDMSGPIFSFVVGGREQTHALFDALELIDVANNIGDARTLICHPCSTAHAAMSAEDRADLVEGLDRAVRAARL